jgi:DNA-directed RNA polymerase specialized sigma24 family protein
MLIAPPQISDLRSPLEAVNKAAWAACYSLLWEAGMAIARIRLAGSRFEPDREDVVSGALQELVRGMIERRAESYNQISNWDDCLRMTRHIVRQRIKDFHSARERQPVDTFEHLPEPTADFKVESRFRLEELLPEVDRLQPDPPVPQVFRDRFLEGWSTDEIAERHQINRNTLLTYFSKGLRTLRERLTRLEGNVP